MLKVYREVLSWFRHACHLIALNTLYSQKLGPWSSPHSRDTRQGIHSKDKGGGEEALTAQVLAEGQPGVTPLDPLLQPLPSQKAQQTFFFWMELFNFLADHRPFSMDFLSTLCFSKELGHQVPLFSWSSSGSSLAPVPDLCPMPVPRHISHRGHIIFNEFENLSGSFFSSSSLSFNLISAPPLLPPPWS